MLSLLVMICAMKSVICEEWPDDSSDIEIDESSYDFDEKRGPHDGRIVGGVEAKISDYPYVVQVLSSKGGFVGGGSIITKRFIVTAAHIGEADPVAVLVGSGIRMMGTRHEVDMIKHERFAHAGWKNDIALLKLRKPLVFSDTVKRIKLGPRSGELDKRPTAEVIGFGETEERQLSNKLLKAKLKILTEETCKAKAITGRANPSYLFQEHICAANYEEKKDSCTGDSGGPLIVKSSQSEHILIGVVSFGPKDCMKFKNPAYYTRISSYVDWILAKIKLHGGANRQTYHTESWD